MCRHANQDLQTLYSLAMVQGTCLALLAIQLGNQCFLSPPRAQVAIFEIEYLRSIGGFSVGKSGDGESLDKLASAAPVFLHVAAFLARWQQVRHFSLPPPAPRPGITCVMFVCEQPTRACPPTHHAPHTSHLLNLPFRKPLTPTHSYARNNHPRSCSAFGTITVLLVCCNGVGGSHQHSPTIAQKDRRVNG